MMEGRDVAGVLHPQSFIAATQNESILDFARFHCGLRTAELASSYM